MNKTKFQTVYGVRIYPINYLMNNDLTESDLNHLFDTKSLLYSLIIEMHKFAGIKRRNCDIIKSVKNKDWMLKTTWSQSQFKQYEEYVEKIFKNVYQYGNVTCKQKAQWFMSLYGFAVK